jgi:transcriptional regulator with XRE-family HTH domain
MKASTYQLPLPVARALRQIGQDINTARRRRRIQLKVLADRASVSPQTISRLEKGEQGISLGVYARVLYALGLLDQLVQVTDSATDRIGMDLADEALPERIRYPRLPAESDTANQGSRP